VRGAIAGGRGEGVDARDVHNVGHAQLAVASQSLDGPAGCPTALCARWLRPPTSRRSPIRAPVGRHARNAGRPCGTEATRTTVEAVSSFVGRVALIVGPGSAAAQLWRERFLFRPAQDPRRRQPEAARMPCAILRGAHLAVARLGHADLCSAELSAAG
jgi:hypothetical protein